MGISQPKGSQRFSARRRFLKQSTSIGVATSLGLLDALPGLTTAPQQPPAESLVAQLVDSLTEKQTKMCTYAFDHPLRSKVDANWHITEARIGRHFSDEQQELIREIFQALHSPEYVDVVTKQVEHDGGLKNCSVALFGRPDQGKFEFVLTGRHVTRRCDGDSVAGAAFGGPIFYGHSAAGLDEPADHPGNAYWYQAKRANELFQAFDGKQRELALQGSSRPENGNETVKLADDASQLVGLPVSEMSADQRQLARHVMADVLAPFRETDRQEAMKWIEKNGFDQLHFSYYKNHDIGDDGVWDVWQIEGPAMVWYFRGAPHVHTWVNIRSSS